MAGPSLPEFPFGTWVTRTTVSGDEAGNRQVDAALLDHQRLAHRGQDEHGGERPQRGQRAAAQAFRLEDRADREEQPGGHPDARRPAPPRHPEAAHRRVATPAGSAARSRPRPARRPRPSPRSSRPPRSAEVFRKPCQAPLRWKTTSPGDHRDLVVAVEHDPLAPHDQRELLGARVTVPLVLGLPRARTRRARTPRARRRPRPRRPGTGRSCPPSPGRGPRPGTAGTSPTPT